MWVFGSVVFLAPVMLLTVQRLQNQPQRDW
jgi:hypothetical protein